MMSCSVLEKYNSRRKGVSVTIKYRTTFVYEYHYLSVLLHHKRLNYLC